MIKTVKNYDKDGNYRPRTKDRPKWSEVRFYPEGKPFYFEVAETGNGMLIVSVHNTDDSPLNSHLINVRPRTISSVFVKAEK